MIDVAIQRARALGSREPELEADLEKLGARINYELGVIEPVEP